MTIAYRSCCYHMPIKCQSGIDPTPIPCRSHGDRCVTMARLAAAAPAVLGPFPGRGNRASEAGPGPGSSPRAGPLGTDSGCRDCPAGLRLCPAWAPGELCSPNGWLDTGTGSDIGLPRESQNHHPCRRSKGVWMRHSV